MVALVTKKTVTRQTRNVYSDFNADFEIDKQKQDLVQVFNEFSVAQSIKNILLTNRGERLYSDLGSDLNNLLFENAVMGMEAEVKTLITNAVENYEPRAKIIDVQVTIDNDIGALAATITFITINNEEPQTLDVVINRIR